MVSNFAFLVQKVQPLKISALCRANIGNEMFFWGSNAVPLDCTLESYLPMDHALIQFAIQEALEYQKFTIYKSQTLKSRPTFLQLCTLFFCRKDNIVGIYNVKPTHLLQKPYINTILEVFQR